MAKVLINTGKSNDDIARKYFSSEQREKARKKRKNLEDEILVYAVDLGGPGVSGEARLHIAGENYKTIATYSEVIKSMCFHKNELYFAAGKCIYSTKNKIAKRPGLINALCSHKDVLHDAGEYRKIYSESNEKIKSWLGNLKFNALCVSNNNLFSAHVSRGEYQIARVFEEVLNAASQEPIKTICSHEEKLYHSEGNKIRRLGEEKSKSRPNQVNILCSWNDNLFDAGEYFGIYDTKKNEKILDTDKSITAMCSIPKRFARELLKNV